MSVKKAAVVPLFVCLMLSAVALFSKTVSPDDTAIRYCGRMDVRNPSSPVMCWPGNSAELWFTGPSVSVVLSDTGKNYFAFFIDDNDKTPTVVRCDKGEKEYAIASGLSEGAHKVTVFRRTETYTGPTAVKGFIIDDGGSVLPPQKPYAHRIEFYGDSITCGMGNEDFTRTNNNPDSLRNNYLAYGAVTARAFNAEYRCIAKSGIGIMISWFDQIMPEFYNRLNPDDANLKWDFAAWTPDVVVVNLFQNDSWLVGKKDMKHYARRLPNGKPSEDEIIAAHTAFIQSLRAVYPNAGIICSLGSMDATREGNPWPGYVRTSVDGMRAGGDTNIHLCLFEYKNTGGHPTVDEHAVMAEKLISFIRSTFGW